MGTEQVILNTIFFIFVKFHKGFRQFTYENCNVHKNIHEAEQSQPVCFRYFKFKTYHMQYPFHETVKSQFHISVLCCPISYIFAKIGQIGPMSHAATSQT